MKCYIIGREGGGVNIFYCYFAECNISGGVWGFVALLCYYVGHTFSECYNILLLPSVIIWEGCVPILQCYFTKCNRFQGGMGVFNIVTLCYVIIRGGG